MTMELIREDEEDILARLESRLETVNKVVSRLRQRNAELELQLQEAVEARDAAVAKAEQASEKLAQAAGESELLRTRQKQAASRIKNLLSQMEQLDLQPE